jgi:hypothetical protein
MEVEERRVWSTFRNVFHFALQDDAIDIAIVRHTGNGQMPWIPSIRRVLATDFHPHPFHRFRHHRVARRDRYDKTRVGLRME